MRKSLFFAVAMITLAACTREMDVNNPVVDMTLTARTETSDDTRTVVESETHVFWEPGDEINVFAGRKSGKFTTDISASCASAEFKGTLGNDAWTEGMDLWAVYPYSQDAAFSDETVTTVLPARQVARAGSFGKDMNLAIAHSKTSDLQFYNVGGGVRFSLSQEGIREVIFEGMDSEILAGKVTIGFQNGVPAVSDVTEGMTSITVVPDGDGTFEKDTWYYIIAIPGALEKGFKLHFNSAAGMGSKIFEKPVTIKRAVYGNLANADDGVTISSVSIRTISFSDERVKTILLHHFDTNQDDDISYREAASVLSFLVPAGTRAGGDMASIFAGTDVVSFDELVFFTGLSRIEDGVFAGCAELTSVTLPENITAVGDHAFDGCTDLETVTVTSPTPPAIGTDAFANSGNCPITVPEDAVDAYLEAWSEYAPRIRTYEYPEPEAVDMGVSVKWASFNLGAAKPEETGHLFAWAETEPKTVFAWENYRWYNVADDSVTKYNTYVDDNRYNLEPEDDAAAVKLGGEWRMPTNAELVELYSNCAITPETINGVSVYKLTSKVNGNVIYLPRSGYLVDSSVWDPTAATFWTSSLYSYFTFASSGLICFDWEGKMIYQAHLRFSGVPVRPVSGGFGIPVESVTLDKSEMTLYVGETATLTATVFPENATIRDYSWFVTNSEVISVSDEGVVTGLNPGRGSVNVVSLDGRLSARCDVTVRKYEYSAAVPETVDLGLSVKWASFNLGATKPEEYGDYFAWGETQPYYTSLDPLAWKIGLDAGYNWGSYKWCMGTENSMTKYCTNAEYGYNGFTDNKVVLDARDDAAHINLGGKWRMPTEEEMEELWMNCSFAWTERNGVAGLLVTSQKPGYTDASIFLPANGIRAMTDLYYGGEEGAYWTAGNNVAIKCNAGYFAFESGRDNLQWGWIDRCYGLAIRPVYDDAGDGTAGWVFWENDGTRGEINWTGDYRFGLEGHDPDNECLWTFPSNVWKEIKTNPFHLLFEGMPDFLIRITTGWWIPDLFDGPKASIGLDDKRIVDNGDGTYTLTVDLEGSDLVDYLDERHLLFTGEGYTPLKLYSDVEAPDPGDEITIWENDGNYGTVSWTGDLRFAKDGMDYDGRAAATFSESVWNVIRNGTFYLEVEGTNPYIRITTGWWDVQWGADIEPGDPRLFYQEAKDSWLVEINFDGDPILDTLDEHNLLFTGNRFTPVRLFYIN